MNRRHWKTLGVQPSEFAPSPAAEPVIWHNDAGVADELTLSQGDKRASGANKQQMPFRYGRRRWLFVLIISLTFVHRSVIDNRPSPNMSIILHRSNIDAIKFVTQPKFIRQNIISIR